MSEFNNPGVMGSKEEGREPLSAYVSSDGTSIWIEQPTGEISIYSRKQAIDLRDWLNKAIGDAE